MSQPIRVIVNGVERSSDVEPRQLLVHYLRDTLNLTGTHVGCDTGQCGACTVLMDGEAVKSCMVLAAQADGAKITTVEGLAQNGEYHPIQKGFWEKHGLQCGFCTPGMMMAAVCLIKDSGGQELTDDEIREQLEGNLCRCTGYQNIVTAVRAAAEEMQTTAVRPVAVGDQA
jgi:aerobic carbon-monoxide dehydrogenase small subunit